MSTTGQPPPPGTPADGPGTPDAGSGPGGSSPGGGARGAGSPDAGALGAGGSREGGSGPAAPWPDPAQEALRDRVAADSLTTRRDYLRIVTTVSGGLAVGAVAVAGGVLHRHGDSADAPEPKRVADRLRPGESIAFRFPGEDDRAVGVRLRDGTLVGYSAVCTHLACAVLWREDRGEEGELYCPCHEGVFDVRTGEVTAGPPPRPLPKVLLVEEIDGSVWAVATTRSGESFKAAMCRQFGERRPDMAARIGCPGARSQPERTERT